ncbi:ABC transporter ATPase [Sphingobacterium corticibacterium]|uniref:ABC transporter ATPase n=1 Tax=Sphingobacterium corticibacterium TaxID=2484746 RepID=A0A4Q6XSY9_9SPHI|nr:ABC transporter ATPase [Sphingobacterium corticibacterium]RZF59677.1 ABC transporter ATPase [Sphingobacterium corticibacterium]
MKRVWIYQSNRFFLQDEIRKIEQILQEFVAQWTAHGNQLAGSFEIRYDLFIVLMVDEEKAMVTGCSIDKSVHLLKKIEQALEVSLFDRLQIAFRRSANEPIQVVPQNVFRSLLAKDEVNSDTVVVFNNMVTSAEELATKWEVPMKASWHSKVFL